MRPATPSFGERFSDWLNAGMVRHSHAVYLRTMTEAVELAKVPGPVERARGKELLAQLELSAEERARLDEASAPPLIYPYWHQARTASDRLSEADLALLAPYL